MQNVLIRMGEASGQQTLSNVHTTLGTLQNSLGATLAAADPASKQLSDLPAGEQQYTSWAVPYPAGAARGKYVGLATLSSGQTADLQVPVVALVRRATDTVSAYEGPDAAIAVTQKDMMLAQDGTANTWVHIPPGYRVVYAAMGVVGTSANVQNPTIDIGADGSQEWAFSGLFNIGVLFNHVEDAFNSYLKTHVTSPAGIDVPIRITANASETIQLNGIQLFLEDGIPGDLDLDRDVDADDFSIFKTCVTGAGVPYNPASLPAGCTLGPDTNGHIPADLDNNGDVDMNDFGIFQRCYSGAGHPANPNCAN
jgi:hypothetical protein